MTDEPNAVPAAEPSAPASAGAFTAAELKTMADWSVEDGSMSRAEADASLARDLAALEGVELPPEGGEAPGTDAGDGSKPQGNALEAAHPDLFVDIDVEAIELDVDNAEAFDTLSPPAKPSEYELPPLGDMSGARMVEIDGQVRGWMAAAEFPRGTGNALMRSVADVAARTETMTDAELTLWTASEIATLRRLHGDKLPQKLALARRMVAEIERKHPGVKDVLDRSGGSRSAAVITALASQAEVLATRQRARRRAGP